MHETFKKVCTDSVSHLLLRENVDLVKPTRYLSIPYYLILITEIIN